LFDLEPFATAAWSSTRVISAVLVLVMGGLFALVVPALNVEQTARLLRKAPPEESEAGRSLVAVLRTILGLVIVGFALYVLVGGT